jgi:hypothetical protein
LVGARLGFLKALVRSFWREGLVKYDATGPQQLHPYLKPDSIPVLLRWDDILRQFVKRCILLVPMSFNQNIMCLLPQRLRFELLVVVGEVQFASFSRLGALFDMMVVVQKAVSFPGFIHLQECFEPIALGLSLPLELLDFVLVVLALFPNGAP